MSVFARRFAPDGAAESDAALEVFDLSRHFASSGMLYAPVSSVFSRFRLSDRAIGVEAIIGGDDDDDGDGDDDGDDDIDETEDELLPILDEHDDVGGTWALRDISFSLANRRSLGVIGPRGAGRTTLIRVLGQIVPPTSGRIVMRGRVGPAIEWASTFTRVDLDVVGNAKMFSKLLRVPRPQRAAFVENFTGLVLGTGRSKLSSAIDTRQATRRIAVAAALDPMNDIVLLDELGLAADVNFHERVLERLELLREQATSVVLATQDISLVRRFCDDALSLDEGEMTGFGPAEDVIIEHRRRRTLAGVPRRRSEELTVHSFSAEAAILGVDTTTADGVSTARFDDGDVVVRIELETAEPGTFVLCSAVFRTTSTGVEVRESDPSFLPDAGRYLISVQVPTNALAAGHYHVDVQADIDHDGGRSVIGRRGVRGFEIPGVGSLALADGGEMFEAGGVMDTIPVAADWTVDPL